MSLPLASRGVGLCPSCFWRAPGEPQLIQERGRDARVSCVLEQSPLQAER